MAVTERGGCYLREIVVIGKVLRKAGIYCLKNGGVLLLNFISRRRNKTSAANSNINEHEVKIYLRHGLEKERDYHSRRYLICVLEME